MGLSRMHLSLVVNCPTYWEMQTIHKQIKLLRIKPYRTKRDETNNVGRQTNTTKQKQIKLRMNKPALILS